MMEEVAYFVEAGKQTESRMGISSLSICPHLLMFRGTLSSSPSRFGGTQISKS